MPRRDMLITTKTDGASTDIPAMFQMSDDEYREYVRNDLLFVDHHGVLRCGPAGYGLATTRGQLDILMTELGALRSEIQPRNEI
jgi:hypothetical protein